MVRIKFSICTGSAWEIMVGLFPSKKKLVSSSGPYKDWDNELHRTNRQICKDSRSKVQSYKMLTYEKLQTNSQNFVYCD